MAQEEQSWEQRALAAEASLQALRDKVVPLVSKTKELEKDAKVGELEIFFLFCLVCDSRL
jgi:hypothetical protein